VGFVIHSLSRCKAINSQGYSLIKTSSLSVSYYLQQIKPVTFAFASIPFNFSQQPNKEMREMLVITMKDDLRRGYALENKNLGNLKRSKKKRQTVGLVSAKAVEEARIFVAKLVRLKVGVQYGLK
jgi:hypothetical protein